MLTKTIPSCLYWEYNDDQDLQAFVDAYNAQTQAYIDWFNAINLPVYAGNAQVVGPLLDWVLTGIYGQPRPVLLGTRTTEAGPLNTYTPNSMVLNALRKIRPANILPTSDDVYKRIATWNLYRGDGPQVNIAWLKRRVVRFLIGVQGTAPNIDETSQVSVTFGAGRIIYINILPGIGVLNGGALFNVMGFNTHAFNEVDITTYSYMNVGLAYVLQQAINAGVVELPFQYTYIVGINA